MAALLPLMVEMAAAAVVGEQLDSKTALAAAVFPARQDRVMMAGQLLLWDIWKAAVAVDAPAAAPPAPLLLAPPPASAVCVAQDVAEEGEAEAVAAEAVAVAPGAPAPLYRAAEVDAWAERIVADGDEAETANLATGHVTKQGFPHAVFSSPRDRR